MTHPTRPTAIAAVVAATLCTLITLTTLSTPAALAAADAAGGQGARDDPKPPAMSIAITDGVERTTPASRLSYTITIRNEYGQDLTRLRIEQALPPSTTRAQGSHNARLKDGRAVWHTEVKAHDKTVVTSAATLSERRDGNLGSASTVCAYLGRATSPTVCASDLDRLPRLTTAADRDGAGDSISWGATWTLAAAGAAGGALYLVRRRKPASNLS